MILKNNYLYIYIFIGSLGLTYLIYIFHKNKELFINNIEKNSSNIKENCKKPTANNPFMNVLLGDDYKNTKKACSYTDNVKENIDKFFYKDIYEDTSNVYNRRSSQRHFYSQPSTTIPNDQDSFAKWCYKKGKTCKEGNGEQCYRNLYRDLRTPSNYAGSSSPVS